MTTLYCIRVERRDFGDLISARGLSRLRFEPVVSVDDLLSPTVSTILAVWSQEPKGSAQLPELLVCKDGTEDDWAAWITTYAAKLRPFSAYMRLITHSHLQRAARDARVPSLDRLVWPVAGVVLGEVLAASRLPDKALSTLSATSCASTLSFTMFRAAAIYSDFREWRELVKAWESVRDITRQRPRSIEGASVARVCATIIAAASHHRTQELLADRDADVVQACRSLIDLGLPPAAFFAIRSFEAAEGKMHGPREDRVVAFDEFVSQIDAGSVSKNELMPFAIGYLASRIAPGTIQHSVVLGPIAHRYPTAPLWYGFCAGFGEFEGNVPGDSPGRGVDLPASARRVARDLLRQESVLGPPVSDIGFSELVALSRTGKDPLEGIITWTQATTTIELAPAVWTTVNLAPKPQATALGREPRDRAIIAALGQQIECLREIYQDLVTDEAVAEQGHQRTLFPSRRKKK